MSNTSENLAVWLARISESALEPELAVIDAHHHLWPKSPIPEFEPWGVREAIDYKVNSGHNVVATVHVEAHANYWDQGPAELRCVGETEFVNNAAQKAIEIDDRAKGFCEGIVGAGNMMLGSDLDRVLQAHQEQAPDRFKGIRFNIASDPDWVAPKGFELEPGLIDKAEFRAAFEKLAERNLSYDTWLMHPQLPDVARLANEFPETTIIVSHVGSPMRIGRFADDKEAAFADWQEALSSCADSPNIFLKLGGLHLSYTGLRVPLEASKPRTSSEIAEVQGPHILTAIEIIGADRCMFETNMPVDGMQTTPTVLWNAYKRISENLSSEDRSNLFSGTAVRAYKLNESIDSGL